MADDFFLCFEEAAPEANGTIPASRETAATKTFNLLQLLNCTSPPEKTSTSTLSRTRGQRSAQSHTNHDRYAPLVIGQRGRRKVWISRSGIFDCGFGGACLREQRPRTSLSSVSKHSFQFVASVVLLLAALTPLMECFDHWDKPGPPINDTEIHLTAWFVGVGVVLTLAKVMRRAVAMVATTFERREAFVAWPLLHVSDGSLVEPTGSPPRIPLRI